MLCILLYVLLEVRKTLIFSLLFLVVIQERWVCTHAWCHIWTFVCNYQKTRETTVKITVSGFSRCAWKCIFSHFEAHDGVARVRNSNLSALTSDNMWYQKILIELLTVLLLLQPHIHFSSSSSLLIRWGWYTKGRPVYSYSGTISSQLSLSTLDPSMTSTSHTFTVVSSLCPRQNTMTWSRTRHVSRLFKRTDSP